MQLFFDPQISTTGIYNLEQQESYHASKVLRLKNNDIIDLTNGQGYFFKAKIISINHNNCTIEVFEATPMPQSRPYKLHIAIAPTKNIERFEWFVEKAVEIGIDTITPIISTYSERKTIKTDRIEKIIISALKQSLKSYKTTIEPLTTFDKFISTHQADNMIIAHCQATQTIETFKLKKNNLFLIGPEGGFSEKEINNAIQHNYSTLLLTDARLRTETAGVHITSLMSFYSFIQKI